MIGTENAFALDENLVENLSRRAVQMLQGHVDQAIPSVMNWPETARRELEIYEGVFSTTI